jgi:SAM-dependent methyltransferase
LEHIPNDKKAMQELYRVLKKGGTLIAQVPLDENRETTFEDDSITDKNERTQIFGQYDHVRIYGKDYYKKLDAAGFKTQGVDFLNDLSLHEIKTFALPKYERIPIAMK